MTENTAKRRNKLRFNAATELCEFMSSVGFEAVTDAVGLLAAVFEKDIGVCVVGIIAERVSVDCFRGKIKKFLKFHFSLLT